MKPERVLEIEKRIQDKAGPLYRCICQGGMPWVLMPGLGCICEASGKLTRAEAIEAYGCVPHWQEIPYCHVCGNEDREELFPYSFFNFGTEDDTNARMIYRCRHHHGHDRGWILFDIFTGVEVTL